MLIPTSITSKWQMTIPREIRKALGLKKPGRVLLSLERKQKILKIHQPKSIFDLAGTFHPKRNKGVSVLKARDYFERHYKRT